MTVSCALICHGAPWRQGLGVAMLHTHACTHTPPTPHRTHMLEKQIPPLVTAPSCPASDFLPFENDVRLIWLFVFPVGTWKR